LFNYFHWIKTRIQSTTSCTFSESDEVGVALFKSAALIVQLFARFKEAYNAAAPETWLPLKYRYN
jgi:hypothetical protein